MSGLEIVYEAVNEINSQVAEEDKIELSSGTPLMSDGSKVDSLQLITLLGEVELLVEKHLGKSIVLVDEAVFSASEKPLSTLGSLANYVDKLVA